MTRTLDRLRLGVKEGVAQVFTAAETRALVAELEKVVPGTDEMLRARAARMEDALRLIARLGCENNTRGACWDDGRTRGAHYTADRWCDACVAADALGLTD